MAGTSSGVGKTTVALALAAALTRQGLCVQTFRPGPDYIDPSYHTAALGDPCRNLDKRLLPPAAILELFYRTMAGKDVAVVEGVMGLYEGATGEDKEGSTAELAKILGLPVALVLDASKSSRSVGATTLGFKAFDSEVNLAGAILNDTALGNETSAGRRRLKRPYTDILRLNGEAESVDRAGDSSGRRAGVHFGRLGRQRGNFTLVEPAFGAFQAFADGLRWRRKTALI